MQREHIKAGATPVQVYINNYMLAVTCTVASSPLPERVGVLLLTYATLIRTTSAMRSFQNSKNVMLNCER